MTETLNSNVAARLIEHLRDDTTDMAPDVLEVPVAHFVTRERAEKERALLRRLPVVVAHCSELSSPGDFITRTVLDTPLLICRSTDGSVAAYLNMCRHRGGIVESDPSGSKRVFSCQYHGWTYDRDDGALRNIPYAESFGDVGPDCTGLHRLGAEERHGLIWVDFSNDPDLSIERHLGPDVDEQVSSFGIDRAVVFLDEVFELDINWKLVMDGANDILHLRFLHPDGVGKLITTGTSAFVPYGPHGHQFSPRKRLESLARDGGTVDDVWKYVGANLRLFPNSMLIASPDHVEFWTVWPEADPARSRVSIRFFVREDILDDAMAERVTRSWEILRDAARDEDFPMEESIQTNAMASPDDVFRYGRNELSIQHFHLQLEKHIDTDDAVAVGDPARSTS